MADVITLSSDSDEDESDVEIIGSYSNIMTKPDPQPLTDVRVYVDAVDVKVPTRFIDLTNPRWTLPELKVRKRRFSMIDLTESNTENGTEETERFPLDDCPKKEDKNPTSNKQYFKFEESSSGDPPFSVPQQNCGKLKEDQSCIDLQTHHQKQPGKAHCQSPVVKLRRLPFLETYKTELNTTRCSVYVNKDCTQMSLQPRQLESNNEKTDCISNLRTTIASNGPPMELLQKDSPPELIESSTPLKAKISLDLESPANFACPVKQSSVAILKTHSAHRDEGPFQRDALKQLELDQVNSEENDLPDQLFPLSRATELNHAEFSDLHSQSHTIPVSRNSVCKVDPAPNYEDTPAGTESEGQFEEVNADEAPKSPDLLHCNVSGRSPLSVSEFKDMDDASGPGTCRGDLEIDDPVYLFWQDWSYEEQANEESSSDTDFRAASQEDRDFVCPFALRKIMSGQPQALIYGEDEGFGNAEVLCRHSLRLVYSTIDENYTEGTLQLLSDLLQPGYYPPRDITFHLLHGILLDPQCPYHLCVQAFNLLMRTQRHHLADKNTVPWDWELLTSVMANQEHTKRYRCEVVRMLVEYVVQTLEDDFQSKRSSSALHHSIAKATLSCDQQFPHVREVLKWLFTAIMKSTEHRESTEAAKERDEQIRMVSIFQRMLSLALEVDRSPALHSAKLSQELFHMLIGSTLLRAHRMLLLESLQSKLLRCKLLEHLLDYACPVKSTLPMSLSLLLHLMKNCTLAPDPTDGTERWQKWEELVHLLWMLLLSYNKAMKGYLCSSFAEQQGRLGTYKRDDMVSKSAVCEAVEAFLSRSQADLGQALPLHVEESLGYLQDHLLDVCQC